MSQSAVITCRVTITSKSLAGDSIAKVFNNVRALNFDYFDGTVNIVDETGSFTFGISLATTVTYTIVGTVTTVVIS